MWPSCLFLELGPEKALTARDAKNSAKCAKTKTLVILRKPVAGLSDTALAKFVARASRASKLEGAVNVLVTGSSELRSLNRRFRGKDQPTDVLSFPPGPIFVNGLAGDIAISADIAKQNARRLGYSAAQEIKILTLHGVLHLVGYDHETDQGTMAGKEAKLRRSLGLPLGLIERNMKKSPKRVPAKAAGEGARATRAVR
jgi:probable rRNA maturation factor